MTIKNKNSAMHIKTKEPKKLLTLSNDIRCQNSVTMKPWKQPRVDCGVKGGHSEGTCGLRSHRLLHYYTTPLSNSFYRERELWIQATMCWMWSLNLLWSKAILAGSHAPYLIFTGNCQYFAKTKIIRNQDFAKMASQYNHHQINGCDQKIKLKKN